jgi:hypothetical protein
VRSRLPKDALRDHANGAPIDTPAVAAEICATKPLSISMSEKIDGMRRWAEWRRGDSELMLW